MALPPDEVLSMFELEDKELIFAHVID